MKFANKHIMGLNYEISKIRWDINDFIWIYNPNWDPKYYENKKYKYLN
jgi:hypothetical protein